MSPRSPIAAAFLVALLLAPAARADQVPQVPEHTPVPAGQLQHTIVDITFPPDKNSQKPQKHGLAFHNLRNERWMTATAGRETVTDTTTGKLRTDCHYSIKDVRCWFSKEEGGNYRAGTIRIIRGKASLLRSWLDESWGVRSLLDQGYYHVTGTTTFLGRPALTIADKGPAPSPDGGTATTSLIVDADTYFTLWREDRNIDMPIRHSNGKLGKEQVAQDTETKVMEVISPKGVKLSLGSHPGAHVEDQRVKHKKPKHKKGY
jgi:hypothetical protein